MNENDSPDTPQGDQNDPGDERRADVARQLAEIGIELNSLESRPPTAELLARIAALHSRRSDLLTKLLPDSDQPGP